jgi:hypothetical protein
MGEAGRNQEPPHFRPRKTVRSGSQILKWIGSIRRCRSGPRWRRYGARRQGRFVRSRIRRRKARWTGPFRPDLGRVELDFISSSSAAPGTAIPSGTGRPRAAPSGFWLNTRRPFSVISPRCPTTRRVLRSNTLKNRIRHLRLCLRCSAMRSVPPPFRAGPAPLAQSRPAFNSRLPLLPPSGSPARPPPRGWPGRSRRRGSRAWRWLSTRIRPSPSRAAARHCLASTAVSRLCSRTSASSASLDSRYSRSLTARSPPPHHPAAPQSRKSRRRN